MWPHSLGSKSPHFSLTFTYHAPSELQSQHLLSDTWQPASSSLGNTLLTNETDPVNRPKLKFYRWTQCVQTFCICTYWLTSCFAAHEPQKSQSQVFGWWIKDKMLLPKKQIRLKMVQNKKVTWPVSYRVKSFCDISVCISPRLCAQIISIYYWQSHFTK